MSWSAAIAVALALLLYLRSPVDLVPDRVGAIGLLDDLVAMLLGAWWMRRRLARRWPAPGARDVAQNAPWDPHAVLGVERDASAQEITRAYREQMRRYHPDHVAHLGAELRELAHRKALEIQRAYDQIGRS
jgi:DnaJ-domain-containing protein 1